MKALVLGDLMLDCYVFGLSNRVSPEAPVLILKRQKIDFRLGGAANVARNLRALGADVSLCGVVGNDDNADILFNLALDIDLSLVSRIASSTIKKTRFIANAQQVLRFDEEEEFNLTNNVSIMLLGKIKERIKEFDCLILSDYAKGFLTPSFTKAIVSLASAENIPILCDPKGDDYSKYAGATLITPNKKEASEASKIDIISDESLLLALKEIYFKHSFKNVIITLGDGGMALFDGTSMLKKPTLAREVYDVTGAGDSVIAALAFSMHTKSLRDSLDFANTCAAISISKVGSSSVTLEEIKQFSGHTSKLIEDINAIPRNKKLVFTNGCFDILHAGHISYLREAKSLGDILVLGLNSDDSIRQIKGQDRPINSIEDRVAVLSALDFIDYIVIFDELTPFNLIKDLKPDILVKGGDYKIEDIVGREFAKETVIIKYIEGKSTTNIINKIRDIK